MNLSTFVKKIKPGDAAAVIVIIFTAVIVALFFLKPSGHTAVIRQDGRALYTVDLSDGKNEGKTFTVKGAYTNTLTVKDHTIFVSSSDCPGQDCVHSAPLGAGGSIICCAPNHMTVSLQKGGPVDVITR